MKILGSLFRLLCALLVLLSVAVYLDGSTQVSLSDYLSAFTPEHVQSLVDLQGWLAVAAGVLLLLTLCCGMKLGWNIVYSLATMVFFAEVTLLTLGPDVALPSSLRGQGWEPMLSELALNYPVPTLMIPSLCILGCLCSSAPVRIAGTSLISFALFYACSELLPLLVECWQTHAGDVAPQILEILHHHPWLLVAASALLFLQFTLFMAMIETFAPRGRKSPCAPTMAEETEKEAQQQDKNTEEADKEAVEQKNKAIVPSLSGVAPVRMKRPVIHKKSPISASADAAQKNEAEPEPEPAAEEPEAATAPEKSPEKEDPTADAPAAEEAPTAKAKETEAPEQNSTTEEAPAAEEPKEQDAPATEAEPSPEPRPATSAE